ncbi:hypothetical protein CEUSTIGMA_g13698.t1 [Chlamydomonas eustigma]|uniref:Uncharacterized protein n=1 Tax=Chlamydomonas eustigma TaxID=1157962 RepID=A0A250XTB8_9CHLO|nr:hypothetical protein CEUSTIGMA_g13698.t1 [Chlamydomonas eustigma]|eukprot:GAX86286.1 hypothetical protein CEUSTIGMA_g13698.t1 [Chlamydomonas eustigma]
MGQQFSVTRLESPAPDLSSVDELFSRGGALKHGGGSISSPAVMHGGGSISSPAVMHGGTLSAPLLLCMVGALSAHLLLCMVRIVYQPQPSDRGAAKLWSGVGVSAAPPALKPPSASPHIVALIAASSDQGFKASRPQDFPLTEVGPLNVNEENGQVHHSSQAPQQQQQRHTSMIASALAQLRYPKVQQLLRSLGRSSELELHAPPAKCSSLSRLRHALLASRSLEGKSESPCRRGEVAEMTCGDKDIAPRDDSLDAAGRRVVSNGIAVVDIPAAKLVAPPLHPLHRAADAPVPPLPNCRASSGGVASAARPAALLLYCIAAAAAASASPPPI